MWKQIFQLFKKDSLTDEAFAEAMVMLRESQSMFKDAVAFMRSGGISTNATVSSTSTSGMSEGRSSPTSRSRAIRMPITPWS